MSSVEVKLLFFGKSKDLTGLKEDILCLDNSKINGNQLIDLLVNKYPRLVEIKQSVRLALNENYIDLDQSLDMKKDDELALIPPLSGELTQEKLNLEHITDLASSPECGAISIFIGTTRNNMNGRPVTRLEYEAYHSMALKEMKKICEQIRDKWKSIKNIVIYHRLGEVKIKEASIIIAISSPHRKDSLEAVDFCINEVKKMVPIWKKVCLVLDDTINI